VKEEKLFSEEFYSHSRSLFLWLSRKIINFETQFWAQVKDNGDIYSLLNFLMERRNSLEFSEGDDESCSPLRTFRIVSFLESLIKLVQKHNISRNEASKEGFFWSFIRSIGK
jgi:hypothetical protein